MAATIIVFLFLASAGYQAFRIVPDQRGAGSFGAGSSALRESEHSGAGPMKREVKWGGPIEAQTLFRCLCAVHLSSYVDTPFSSRGGLMLVSPPGSMKTSILMAVANSWPNAIPVSDLNTAQLIKMKSAMSSNQLRTLILTDMQKIAQRNPNVAANLLGNLSAIVDEGFTGASWDSNQMIPRTTARCTLLAALTDDYYNRAMEEFVNNGFARRFLWAQIRLRDPGVLAESVIHQERLAFSQDIALPPQPTMSTIPLDLTEKEIRELEPCVQYQVGRNAIAYQLIVKMVAVLKWWYKAMKIELDPFETIFEFARCLGTNTEPSSIVGLHIPSMAPIDTRAAWSGIQGGSVTLPDTGPGVNPEQLSNRQYKNRGAKIIRDKVAAKKAGKK
jgi:hypothetical protein